MDDGCRLHQYHGVQGLRPDPVKPHPKQPVCGEKLKPTFMLPPQHGHLMPKGDELKFQVGAATKAHDEIAKALNEPSIKARVKQLGADPMPMKPTEFEAFLKAETASNATLIKAAGIKPN